jgi:hypothetical protein
MSASEKLKALAPAINQAMHVDEYAEAAEPLAAALPQIVAVVEAAEKFSDRLDTPGYMRDALAALEEALS